MKPDARFYRNIAFYISRNAKLFLKFRVPHKGPDETCYVLSHILSRVDVVLKIQTAVCKMICYIHGTGLLSFNNYKMKHELLNSSCPTSQDKKRQIFFTLL